MLALRKKTALVSTDFLKIDIATALTFAKNAREASDDFRKWRNCRAARKAYEAVTRLAGKVELSSGDRVAVREGLDRLKMELQQLGETF